MMMPIWLWPLHTLSLHQALHEGHPEEVVAPPVRLDGLEAHHRLPADAPHQHNTRERWQTGRVKVAGRKKNYARGMGHTTPQMV